MNIIFVFPEKEIHRLEIDMFKAMSALLITNMPLWVICRKYSKTIKRNHSKYRYRYTCYISHRNFCVNKILNEGEWNHITSHTGC